MNKEKIGYFETTQCHVCVYKTDIEYKDEIIYVIETVHKKNGKLNVRFGNCLQSLGIVNTYAKLWSRRPEIKW